MARDKVIEGGWIPAEQAQKIRTQTIETAKSPIAKVNNALTAVVVIFVLMCVFAVLYLLGVLVFGGRINFWQALSVAVYAALPPLLLQNLLSLLLLYIKSPDDIDPVKGQRGLVHADLGLLFNSADHPMLYVLGSFIGVFTIYSVWLTATGLRHGGEKVSNSSSWTIAIGLWALGLLLGLASAALFPSFI